MRALILAAGAGTRLKPLTDRRPKALLPIRGQALLERTFDALPDEISEIFLVVGHLQKQIMDHFKLRWNNKRLHYLVQEPLDGTGRAVHLAKEFVQHEKFLVVNGDDLYAKADLERLLGHDLSMLVAETKDAVAYSALEDEKHSFAGFESNAPDDEIKLRVCGAYVLDGRFFRYPLAMINVRDHKETSLPHTLVSMSRDCRIVLERASFWLPIGTPDEYANAQAVWSP